MTVNVNYNQMTGTWSGSLSGADGAVLIVLAVIVIGTFIVWAVRQYKMFEEARHGSEVHS